MTNMELPRQEADALRERVRTGATPEADHDKLKAILETLGYRSDLVADKETTMRQLRQLLLGFWHFPRTTEKTKDVQGNGTAEAKGWASAEAAAQSEPAAEEESRPAAGHGRHGASDYQAAKKVVVRHPERKPGDPCPECPKGKVYVQKEPAQRVRIVGRVPLPATV